MDLGAFPHRSRRLAGLSPSTYPPPLGERPRKTMSHTNSHTMEDHSETIPEPPPPVHIDDGELTPTYDPSPDLV